MRITAGILLVWAAIGQAQGVLPAPPTTPADPLPILMAPDVKDRIAASPGNPVPMPAVEIPPVNPATPPLASSLPIAGVTPVVTVEMQCGETANLGRPVAWTLVVRNSGKCAVYQTKLEVDLPPSVKYVNSDPRAELPGEHITWNLGILDPGVEKRIKLTVQASAEGEARPKATISYASSCIQSVKFTRPRLAIAITGPESALVGEPVEFQIRISNNGSGAISKLLLRNRLPAGLSHPAGSLLEAEVAGLAPGETRTVTLKTKAIAVGTCVNEIEAVADGSVVGGVQLVGGVRNADLEASAKATLRIVEPGLQVRLTGPKTCLVKCDALFSIDLSNPGTAATRNVRLAHRLPEGVEFLGASDGGLLDAPNRTVNWIIPLLEPGARKMITVKARGSSISNGSTIAVAHADGNLGAKAELPVQIEGVPALTVEVVDVDDPAPVGAEVTYDIRVLNQGTCPCTGIQIVVQLPEGVELRQASAPTPYKVQGQQVQFAAFAKLATKADLIYRLKVRSGVTGDLRFRVQLTADQLQQPVFKEESSRFFKP